MTTLRGLEIDGYAALEIKGEPGAAPQLQWLPVDLLVVDDAYQRQLSATTARVGEGLTKQQRKTVRAIAEGFRWSRFSPVIVAPVEGGRYAVVDGQHRSTAAKLRGIPTVPCMVILADQAEQAAAFASINGNTTRMTNLALHHAAVAAGQPEAVTVARCAKAAGVRILRSPTMVSYMKPGDTIAVGAMTASLRAYGEQALITALRCVTRTAHNRPGALGAITIRGLACVAALAGDHELLIEAVGKLRLSAEVESVSAARVGGVSGWSALAERLKRRLGPVLSARAPGSPAGRVLSPRDLEKATEEGPTVRRLRAAGVPWSHVARQLGATEFDVRRRHDPEFHG